MLVSPVKAFQYISATTTNATTLLTRLTVGLIPTNTYGVHASAIAQRTDAAGESAFYIRYGCFRTSATSVVAQVGNIQAVGTAEDSTAWDCSFSTTGAGIDVEVKGGLSKTILWLVSVTIWSMY